MCLLHTKDNKAVANSGSGKLIVKWWSIPFSTKFEQCLLVFASERNISYYIFQNISRRKLIVTHEKIPDTIKNR